MKLMKLQKAILMKELSDTNLSSRVSVQFIKMVGIQLIIV